MEKNKKILYSVLTSISIIPTLRQIWCYDCPMLTYIPNTPEKLYCSGCPWLPQNPYNKILLGRKLQRFIKKNFKYFTFKKWINSEKGKEFLYDPEHIGGRIEKVKIKKTFELYFK